MGMSTNIYTGVKEAFPLASASVVVSQARLARPKMLMPVRVLLGLGRNCMSLSMSEKGLRRELCDSPVRISEPWSVRISLVLLLNPGTPRCTGLKAGPHLKSRALPPRSSVHVTSVIKCGCAVLNGLINTRLLSESHARPKNILRRRPSCGLGLETLHQYTSLG